MKEGKTPARNTARTARKVPARATADKALSAPAAAASGGTKALRNALKVLLAFASEQKELGVGELAEACGISKGQVSKILSTYAETGLLVQNPESRRYAVGVRLFALGSRFVNYDKLCREAMPVMRELLERTGHSTRLSVRDADQVLYLLGLEGPLFLDTGWRAGTWLPLNSTSAGRVILAFMEPAHARDILNQVPMRALTARTITDRAQVQRLVELVRARGYAVQRGETTPELGTIAVPVFGAGQAIVGTLGIAFPVHRVAPAAEGALVEVLHEHARILSQRLGSTVYPFGGIETAAPGSKAASPRVRNGRAAAASS